MTRRTDPAIVAFCGSETRARTLGVLANASFPMSGYRVAKVAGLAEPKVYAELRRAVGAGTVRRTRAGYVLVDADLRTLLRLRVRLYWDKDWDRSRAGWASQTPRLLQEGLAAIQQRLRSNRSYLRPRGWKPPAGARELSQELKRAPAKDAALRRRARRTSKREDWAR